MVMRHSDRTVLRTTNEVMERQPLRRVGSHYACPYCSGTYPGMWQGNGQRMNRLNAVDQGLASSVCTYCGGAWKV